MQREVIGELKRTIGFDRWCWVQSDPDSLVPLGGLAVHDYGPQLTRVLELEYSGDDFAAMDIVARRDRPAASLGAETGGDFARSPRWDEVLRWVGIGDEAVVACRDAFGCWGWIKTYRDRSDPSFTADDIDLLVDLGPLLGSVVRRRVAAGRRTVPSVPMSPGVIVLGPDLAPVSWTASAHAWIDALPGAALFAGWGMLPAEVYPLATLVRSRSAESTVSVLDRDVDGRWVKMEAAHLDGDDKGKIAITLREAVPLETFGLLCRASRLSPRERDVAQAVIAGLDTCQVSERLFISRHTVQDHLKSVFAKLGVRSRRELLTALNVTADAG